MQKSHSRRQSQHLARGLPEGVPAFRRRAADHIGRAAARDHGDEKERPNGLFVDHAHRRTPAAVIPERRTLIRDRNKQRR